MEADGVVLFSSYRCTPIWGSESERVL